jgi:hypothetical protein
LLPGKRRRKIPSHHRETARSQDVGESETRLLGLAELSSVGESIFPDWASAHDEA